MDFNGDLNLATLQPAPVFPELYQELWVYSGSYASINATSAGSAWIKKGATSTESTLDSAGKFFVLNSNWPASQKYSFEATLWSSGTSYTAYAELWDATAGTAVTSSQLSTSSATATVMRSGQFTLTPGHTYGITIWSSGGQVNITDASLIIFPSSPLTSPSVSAISLANPSGNMLKEAPIPLWVYSSGQVAYAVGGSLTAIQKGTINTVAIGSIPTILPLSSSWSPSQKFALEASIYIQTVGSTVGIALYDKNTSSSVSGAQVTSTSTTATVIRSGAFTLTPGHNYGLYFGGTSGTSGNVYLTKAHLVALAN